jgi:hypothetical protein
MIFIFELASTSKANRPTFGQLQWRIIRSRQSCKHGDDSLHQLASTGERFFGELSSLLGKKTGMLPWAYK